jgi:trehalose-6-phosphate synthase
LRFTLHEINSIVNDIHEEFGMGCLVIKHENLTAEKRYAVYSFSNIFFNSALNDGLTLQPLEYISIKQIEKKFNKSTVIMSENCGCARALTGVFQINPYDIDMISNKLDEAINIT